ncbi:hypothetical protein [Flavobacterium tegetincola]|uniref:hypothetical protein n=1 Tax=Flavobacterium tegetincola TaxID=150172 RepID=UPI000417CE91|nr:hypothetical protein [Flavobacterium tegetincola]
MDFEREFIKKVQDELKNAQASNYVITDTSPQYSNIYKIVTSFKDLFLLITRLVFNRSKKFNFVYTGEGICLKVDGVYRDRIVEPLHLSNLIYINRGRDTIIDWVNGVKVYNIGGLVKLFSFVYKFLGKKNYNVYYSYKIINKFILKFAKYPNVYSLLYYNLNGLSLVFSSCRKTFNLIEVQHGTIINFPAYAIHSEIKIADKFYVKNSKTIDYLKQHLNKNFPRIEYEILPYAQSNALHKDGKYILYASTVEFNGIHPVFSAYLQQVKQTENVTVFIRLHPREKSKIELFKIQVQSTKAKIIFDDSRNWLESNRIKNLIVVSPWSSVIEDAVDNNFRTIIIDKIGKERFAYLIDDRNVIFASNFLKLSKAINYDL